MGAAVSRYWLAVAEKYGFAVDQMSFLPDHVHLIVRIVPKMSIEECALALLNNAQYFIGRHYSEVMIRAGVERLWQSSAYAGTCGRVTTAIVKSFLDRD
jgi:Transposase and inactivated derivatives